MPGTSLGQGGDRAKAKKGRVPRDAIGNGRRRAEEYSAMNKWLAYFSRSTTLERMEELVMSETIIQDALQAAQRFMQDPTLPRPTTRQKRQGWIA